MLNRLSLNIRRFLAGWWLRSRFLTYQSPLLLLELFEKLEHPRSPIERAPQRIKLGDTVSLVDAHRQLSFQVTLTTSENQHEVQGGVTCDSLLGAALLGRRQHEVFTLSIWGQHHCFAITHVQHSMQGKPTKLCHACYVSN
ncbi:transcription elongation factor GreAB [Vibrio cholerae]|nr:transcription elongation factor GreAB [Vibrio cholerae]EJL6338531.1 transcription elongation factor GreAB [Vibrio cholerae]